MFMEDAPQSSSTDLTPEKLREGLPVTLQANGRLFKGIVGVIDFENGSLEVLPRPDMNNKPLGEVHIVALEEFMGEQATARLFERHS